MTTGHRYLAETLAACGIGHFFHVPLVLPQAVKEMQALGVRPIVTHSEKAAAYMADGYARASGRLGVCACQAIGAANLAAGLLDAYMAHAPVLALSGGGNANTRDRNNYQEIDQQPIWAGLTKMSARVEHARRLPDLIGQAMRVATTGAPGPTHLELDEFTGAVLDAEIDVPMPPLPRYAAAPAIRHPADGSDVQALAAALTAARRPIVVAGSGIRASRAWDALRAMVHRLQIPLATSLDAKAALRESDPLLIGVVGTYARETANIAVSEADFVLFVGTTTGSMVTAHWTVPTPGVAAAQIDVSPRELGRNYPLRAGLCGDPATILRQLAEAAPAQPDRSPWLARIAMLRAQWADSIRASEQADVAPIRPERLCRSMSAALPDDALLVVDTGHTAAWAARNIYLDRPGQGLLRAAGSLGWAYPAALGAKCAQPDRPVVCLTGDGAFLYHLSEMETALRYGINTVTVISNNHGFSQEKPIWGGAPEYDHNWRFHPISYADTARAFGCDAIFIDNPAKLDAALKDALHDSPARNRPVVIEVITDVDVTAPPPWRPQRG